MLDSYVVGKDIVWFNMVGNNLAWSSVGRLGYVKFISLHRTGALRSEGEHVTEGVLFDTS